MERICVQSGKDVECTIISQSTMATSLSSRADDGTRQHIVKFCQHGEKHKPQLASTIVTHENHFP